MVNQDHLHLAAAQRGCGLDLFGYGIARVSMSCGHDQVVSENFKLTDLETEQLSVIAACDRVAAKIGALYRAQVTPSEQVVVLTTDQAMAGDERWGAW